MRKKVGVGGGGDVIKAARGGRKLGDGVFGLVIIRGVNPARGPYGFRWVWGSCDISVWGGGGWEEFLYAAVVLARGDGWVRGVRGW